MDPAQMQRRVGNRAASSLLGVHAEVGPRAEAVRDIAATARAPRSAQTPVEALRPATETRQSAEAATVQEPRSDSSALAETPNQMAATAMAVALPTAAPRRVDEQVSDSSALAIELLPAAPGVQLSDSSALVERLDQAAVAVERPAAVPEVVQELSDSSALVERPDQAAVAAMAVALPAAAVEAPRVETAAIDEPVVDVVSSESEASGEAETTEQGGAASGTAGDGAAPSASDAEVPEVAAGDVEDQSAGGDVEAATAGAEAEVEEAAPSPRQAIAPATHAVAQRASAAQVHSPVEEAAGAAQAAAIEPGVEQRRGAAVGTVAQLDAAEPADVDRVSFKEQLKQKLREAVPTPSSEAEAERLMDHGAADTSAQLQAAVGTQTAAAAGPVTAAASPENEVSPESQPAEAEVPLVTEAIGEPPAAVSSASVVPEPLPTERLDYSEHSDGADTLMSENQITTDQLARGQEPDFDATIAARSTAETNDAEAPVAFRESEAGSRQQSRARASESLGTGIGDIHGTRVGRVTMAAAQQTTTQSDDAAQRAQVTADIEGIKTATREAVEQILTDMTTEATRLFEEGLGEAETAYNDVFEDEKGGFFSWLGGSLTGTWDAKVERAFGLARNAYEKVVNRTIDVVATYVEKKLAEAKLRVTEGKTEVDQYVTDLDSSLTSFGEEARASIGGDFEAMVGDIDSRRDGLVDSLAAQYGESQSRVSAMEEQLRSENKNLWDAVYDATVGVVQKIIEFKNMLLGLLAKAAEVVGAIIDDPIGFLGNLITGIKAGLDGFVGNIGKHLKDGLMGWLFGALEGAGLTLPTTFDLKGILDLVLQVLGLTKENIRKRAVTILGEPVVSALEQASEIFTVLATEGPAGLWRMLVEKLGDIKETILGEIQDWVITSVIEAGVKWLLSLLNPASAFVKACMMIYDIVLFFIERGSQIIEVVNGIIGALGAIVGGNIKAMASAVEGALAKIIPVAISFLAALLGLGGISEKIREIIEKIQEPVNKAIDWIINKAVSLARKVGSLFGGGETDDEHVDDADPEKAAKVQAALLAIDEAEQRRSGAETISFDTAAAIASEVQRDHPVLSSLRVVDGGGTWDYEYTASPKQTKGGPAKDDANEVGFQVGDRLLILALNDWEVATVSSLADERGIVWFTIETGKRKDTRIGLPGPVVAKGSARIRDFNPRMKGEGGKYSELPDPKSVGPYKHFTDVQKARIIALNRSLNQNGALTSDMSSSVLVAATAREKGVPIRTDEVNIDHIFPRSKGGWNSYANAQVLSFSENLKKLDTIPDA